MVGTKTGYVSGPMHIEPVAIAESSAGFGTGIGIHIQQLTGGPDMMPVSSVLKPVAPPVEVSLQVTQATLVFGRLQ